MSNERVIKYSVRVKCEQSERSDGAWWRIKDVVDDDGLSLGDCGVYEFDAWLGFPDDVSEFVLSQYDELEMFGDESAVYVLDIRLMAGGTQLESSFSRHTKQSRIKRRLMKQRLQDSNLE